MGSGAQVRTQTKCAHREGAAQTVQGAGTLRQEAQWPPQHRQKLKMRRVVGVWLPATAALSADDALSAPTWSPRSLGPARARDRSPAMPSLLLPRPQCGVAARIAVPSLQTRGVSLGIEPAAAGSRVCGERTS